MKKQIFIGIIILNLFIFASCTGDGNTEPDKNKEDVISDSEQVSSDKNFNYSVPKEEVYETSENLLFDKFYPIGWSEDGKFAYISEPADEGTGFYFFDIKIMDITSGKLIWEWKIDQTNEQETGSLSQTWQENKKIFIEKLKENGISQEKIKIEAFPENVNGNMIDLEHKIKREKDKKGFGFDIVSETQAYITINKEKKQLIYEKNYDDNIILNVSCPGFIKSPSGKYVAAIFKTEQWGYEGPPNLITFSFAGFKTN